MNQAIEDSRGHAAFWEYPPARRLAELGPVEELVRYLHGDDSVKFLQFWDADPPDLKLHMPDGTRTGIEVTELVDAKAVERARHLRKQRGPQARVGQILADALWPDWSDERLDSALRGIIRKKNGKLQAARANFDQVLLAIMTDEPDIDMAKAARVAACLKASAPNIDRAFLILSYDPSADRVAFPSGYPIFEIELA